MALSDLSVFSEYAYSAATEVLAQQVDLFNAASEGVISLSVKGRQGDYSDEIYFKKITGLVRRRNPYGTGAVTATKLTQLDDVKVKVAAGTPPIELNPSQWAWIMMDPATAGAAMGQQLAIQTMADMLNTAVGACSAAIKRVGVTVVNDISLVGAGTATPPAMVQTTQLFGDYGGSIQAWVMHSKPMSDLWINALTANAGSFLFTYGTVAIRRDPFGRLFVISDIPALVIASTPNTYDTLGLVPGGIDIERSDDFIDNYSTLNGNENITRTYQAEWSYSLGLKGYAWDKTAGGHAPADAALFTGTNWDAISTSIKDSAGVMLVTK
jgi:hypothetical protein